MQLNSMCTAIVLLTSTVTCTGYAPVHFCYEGRRDRAAFEWLKELKLVLHTCVGGLPTQPAQTTCMIGTFLMNRAPVARCSGGCDPRDANEAFTAAHSRGCECWSQEVGKRAEAQ
ncbi:hypothetical protein FA95DRAFT_300830 [Auriscalpium vulgare]|uniref:Uncharacterized protein n=1 Tax=Auriscalpium vulgare TaxID=40419 RepID=A0ACB8RJU8_9AGAM|nr:hypothetical protein FA95DRAFT_300830 [Auriscalpium vulgare]